MVRAMSDGPKLFKGDEGGPLSRRLVAVRIVRLIDFVNRTSALAYRRLSGLSDFEWRVLARICETPPLSINELSGLLNRNSSQVSRTVSRLVSARLLKRENRGGGPGVSVTPTQLGLAVYAPLVEQAVDINAALIAGLGEEDLANLDRYVEILTANALENLEREQRRWQDKPELP
jgi:DNA-binding MarR family transcriptional regulator